MFWQKQQELTICQLGDPTLRQIAQPVGNVTDRQLQDLIDRMMAILKEKKGVGLAAPQLGQSIRLMIIASHPNQRYPHAPKMAPLTMLNPEIVGRSPEVEKDWEGCLSVPGIRGLVPRAKTIEVAYTTRTGSREQVVFKDFVARIFQHEFDHLEGNVFLDHVESTLEMMTDQEYLKMINKTNS